MKEEKAQSIISDLEVTYDSIASHFSQTRGNLWDELEAFSDVVSDGKRILDLGCGNGRLLELFKKWNVSYVGMDNSAKLLEKAQLKAKEYPQIKTEFIHGDMQTIPLPDASVDVVFCIATLHHIPSKEKRQKALSEMARVLRHEGVLCLTNWYLSAQPKYVIDQVRQRFEHKTLYEGTSFRDFFISWTDKKTKHFRYYYAFSKGELRRIVSSSGFSIERHFVSYGAKDWSGRRKKRNIITLAKKLG